MRTLFLLLGCLAVSGCADSSATPPPTTTVQLFAAASSVDALTALARIYSQQTGVEVRCNFAGSSTLARQIEAGAQADLFLSAHPEWIAHLDGLGALEPESVHKLVANQLVLIAPRGHGFAVRMDAGFDLPSSFSGPIALADPSHVPAGRYARAALQELGWWSGLETRVLATLDVRHALVVVELGECALGVVYATDAQASTRVEVLGSFGVDVHYSLAVCRGSSAAARDFASYLRSAEALEVFARFGFSQI